MSTDRAYTPGGTNAVSGNYTRRSDASPQVLRLLHLQKGSFAPNPTLGTDWESVVKYDENAPRQIELIIRDGQQPLVDAGVIRDLTVEVTAVTDYGVGYVLTYVDATTGDSATYSETRAWTQ
jgi:hypothetical protein